MTPSVVVLALAFLLFAVLMLAIAPVLLRPTPQEQRLHAVVSSVRPNQQAHAGRVRMEEQLLHLATAIRARLGLSLSPTTQKQLELAGYPGTTAGETYFAVSWLTPLLGAFLGSFIPSNTLFCVLIFTAMGYILPGMVLKTKMGRRKERIRRGLPDAMDLLVICVDAGLGLDQAMQRVGAELALSHPDLHQEFARLLSEQKAGRARMEAWQGFTERVPLEELKILVSMLGQAERFGTPMSKGLHRFAEDLRNRRRQRAEEAAAKTKVKIIFPLVFFIFPSLFIVLLAPALLSVFSELAGVRR